MKLFYLLSLLMMSYLSNGTNFGCKAFINSGSADVIGVCLAQRSLSSISLFTGNKFYEETSQQYVCVNNGNGGYNVVSKTYTNGDCIQEDNTEIEIVQTDQDLLDCTSKGYNLL